MPRRIISKTAELLQQIRCSNMRNFFFYHAIISLFFAKYQITADKTLIEKNGNVIDEGHQSTLVRLPMKNFEISKELLNLNEILAMPSSDRKRLTEKQTAWIGRFVISANNWLHVGWIMEISKPFQDLYSEHRKKHFDAWITGRPSSPFRMSYADENTQQVKKEWDLHIFRISVDGLGTAEYYLKSFDIHFERSRTKLQSPSGETLYRKDRVYEAVIEIKLPSNVVKIRHEIVQSDENPRFDPLAMENQQTITPGHMRIKLTNLRIEARIVLTEIDKRFVREDPTTKKKYYFLLPKIDGFKLTVEKAELFNTQLQTTFGKTLDPNKAEKIIRDFVNFLKSTETNAELNERIKTTLLNRFSEPVMTSENIFCAILQLDKEIFFYNPSLPLQCAKKEVKLIENVLYSSYFYNSFYNAASYTLREQFDYSLPDADEEEYKKEAKDVKNQLGWLEKQMEKFDGIFKEIELDEGYDYDEDKAIEETEKVAVEGAT